LLWIQEKNGEESIYMFVASNILSCSPVSGFKPFQIWSEQFAPGIDLDDYHRILKRLKSNM
jgi:hypothetical protein